MLYILSGLPGVGKTTLAKAIASHLNAVYIRIDTIEQQLRESGIDDIGSLGYEIAYAIASDNLRLGLSVVSDSVNPVAISRRDWNSIALQADVKFLNIEVLCSDLKEHQRRVESRTADIPNLKLPSWGDVQTREYETWTEERIVIDTAGRSPEQSTQELIHTLKMRLRNSR